MKMEFKKGQRAAYSSMPVRIESGPWPAGGESGYSGPHDRYLVELLDGVDAGRYRFFEAKELRPVLPKAGDKGRIKQFSEAKHDWHYYSPHTFVYADDKVILLQDRQGDYDTYTGNDRQYVLDTWESCDG